MIIEFIRPESQIENNPVTPDKTYIFARCLVTYEAQGPRFQEVYFLRPDRKEDPPTRSANQ
jgi:hypothetical protein